MPRSFRRILLFSCLAAIGCVILGSVGQAKADMVSYSTSISATDAGGFGSLPMSTSFLLPDFNPAMGTLQSIHIEFTLLYQGEVDIENFTTGTQSFTNASSTVPIEIAAPSSGVPSPLVSASDFESSGTASNSPSLTRFPGAVSNTTFPFDPLPADFGSYTGAGNNSYMLSYDAGTYGGSTNSPPYFFFGGDANSSGTAKVTYTFTPVPEPSTVVLLAFGFVGLLAVTRRQLRRQQA